MRDVERQRPNVSAIYIVLVLMTSLLMWGALIYAFMAVTSALG